MARDANDPEALRQHQELARAVAELGDLEPEELFSLYAVHDIAALDHYQRGKSAAELADDALSPDFWLLYPETAEALGNNTSTYDDEVEDELVTDPVIEEIMMARNQEPNNRALTEAQRVRRSVIVFSMMAFEEAVDDFSATSDPAA